MKRLIINTFVLIFLSIPIVWAEESEKTKGSRDRKSGNNCHKNRKTSKKMCLTA